MLADGTFRSRLGPALAIAVLWLLTPLALAAPVSPPRPQSLLALELVEAPQATIITLRTRQAPAFTSFRLDQPTRLFVDVAGAGIEVGALGSQTVDNGVVRSVEALPFQRGSVRHARIIVTFQRDALYHVKVDGQAVVLTIDGTDRKPAADPAVAAAERERARLQQEAARQAELAQQVEKKRQAELALQAEKQRQAELAQLAEAKRQAELARQAEKRRQAELALQAEKQRRAELAQQAEAKRQAELARQAEKRRQAELALQAEKQRQAVVALAAHETRLETLLRDHEALQQQWLDELRVHEVTLVAALDDASQRKAAATTPDEAKACDAEITRRTAELQRLRVRVQARELSRQEATRECLRLTEERRTAEGATTEAAVAQRERRLAIGEADVRARASVARQGLTAEHRRREEALRAAKAAPPPPKTAPLDDHLRRQQARLTLLAERDKGKENRKPSVNKDNGKDPGVAVPPPPALPKGPAEVNDVAITARGPQQGRIELPLTGNLAGARAQVTERGAKRLVVRVTGVRLPDRLQRAYDTKALLGPVDRVTVFRPEQGSDEARLVVDLARPAVDHLTVANGKVLLELEQPAAVPTVPPVPARVAELRPPARRDHRSGGDAEAPAPQPAADAESTVRTRSSAPSVVTAEVPEIARPTPPRRYTGKRISLTLKDADLQQVLTFLARAGKTNIVAGPDVQGTVTFHLDRVPWDLALDVILRSRGLDAVRQNGVIRVASRAVLDKEAAADVARRQKAEEGKPLISRVIPVSHGDASVLAPQVRAMASKPRGSVAVDVRTNALLVRDTAEQVAAIEAMVRRLDAQAPQVRIEVRIVEADRSFLRESGVQWGGHLAAAGLYGNATGLAFPSVRGVASGPGGPGPDRSAATAAVPNYAVNLPTSFDSDSMGWLLGSLGGAANLHLRLAAAEREGVVRIVASPSIVALNHATATLRQGVELPSVTTGPQGTKTHWIDTELLVRATPHLTLDGQIRLAVQIARGGPERSGGGEAGEGGLVQREASSEWLLRDGETTVVAGLYGEMAVARKSGFWGNLPLIGGWFRHSDDRRSELLIFLTPRIVPPAALAGR
jgi:type IV pilus assembly protein PilQ